MHTLEADGLLQNADSCALGSTCCEPAGSSSRQLSSTSLARVVANFNRYSEGCGPSSMPTIELDTYTKVTANIATPFMAREARTFVVTIETLMPFPLDVEVS